MRHMNSRAATFFQELFGLYFCCLVDCFMLVVIEMEPRALRILGNCSTTGLHPSPFQVLTFKQ